MSNESKLKTQLTVDSPLVQDASFISDRNDRQKIDNQIQALEQHIVDSVIGGVHSTWFVLSGTSPAVTIGDVVYPSGEAAQAGVSAVSKLTGGALSSVKGAAGVVLAAAAPGARVRVATGGTLPASISGLAAGSSQPVRANASTARMERATPPLGLSDFPIGVCDTAGNVTLCIVPQIGQLVSTSSPVFTLASSSAALSPFDVVCIKSGTVQITKGINADLRAVGGPLGIVTGSYSPGDSAVSVSVPGQTVDLSTVLGASSDGLAHDVMVDTNGRPVWLYRPSGAEFVLGHADPAGHCTISIRAPNTTAPTHGFNPRTYGCPWDGVNDDLPGWQAMIAAIIAFGANVPAVINLPPGMGYFSDTPYVSFPCQIIGHGGGTLFATSGWEVATLKDGLVLYASTAGPDGGAGADFSRVEHLDLLSKQSLTITSGAAFNALDVGADVRLTSHAYRKGDVVLRSGRTGRAFNQQSPSAAAFDATLSNAQIFFRATNASTTSSTPGDPAAFATAVEGDLIVDGGVTWQAESLPKEYRRNVAVRPGKYSYVTCTLTLGPTSTVKHGAVVRSSTKKRHERWVLDVDVTSTTAGPYSGVFRSEFPGSYTVDAGALDTIVNTVAETGDNFVTAGTWTAVTNSAAQGSIGFVGTRVFKTGETRVFYESMWLGYGAQANQPATVTTQNTFDFPTVHIGDTVDTGAHPTFPAYTYTSDNGSTDEDQHKAIRGRLFPDKKDFRGRLADNTDSGLAWVAKTASGIVPGGTQVSLERVSARGFTTFGTHAESSEVAPQTFCDFFTASQLYAANCGGGLFVGGQDANGVKTWFVNGAGLGYGRTYDYIVTATGLKASSTSRGGGCSTIMDRGEGGNVHIGSYSQDCFGPDYRCDGAGGVDSAGNGTVFIKCHPEGSFQNRLGSNTLTIGPMGVGNDPSLGAAQILPTGGWVNVSFKNPGASSPLWGYPVVTNDDAVFGWTADDMVSASHFMQIYRYKARSGWWAWHTTTNNRRWLQFSDLHAPEGPGHKHTPWGEFRGETNVLAPRIYYGVEAGANGYETPKTSKTIRGGRRFVGDSFALGVLAGGTFNRTICTGPAGSSVIGALAGYDGPDWASSTSYSEGTADKITPTINNAGTFEFVVDIAGKSGAGPVTWPQTEGATVVDGGVTWRNTGRTAQSHADWAANTMYAVQVFPDVVVPTSGNAGPYAFRVLRSTGNSGGGAPTWDQTVGNRVTDGSVVWLNVGLAATYGSRSDVVEDPVFAYTPHTRIIWGDTGSTDSGTANAKGATASFRTQVSTSTNTANQVLFTIDKAVFASSGALDDNAVYHVEILIQGKSPAGHTEAGSCKLTGDFYRDGGNLVRIGTDSNIPNYIAGSTNDINISTTSLQVRVSPGINASVGWEVVGQVSRKVD